MWKSLKQFIADLKYFSDDFSFLCYQCRCLDLQDSILNGFQSTLNDLINTFERQMMLTLFLLSSFKQETINQIKKVYYWALSTNNSMLLQMIQIMIYTISFIWGYQVDLFICYNYYACAKISSKIIKLTQMTISIKSNSFTKSTSKQKWSFPKSKRFAQYQKTWCKVNCYDNQSTFSKRSSSFGVGGRSKLQNLNSSTIDPGQYNIDSQFDHKNKAKGCSFGYGRDQVKFQNYLKMLNNNPLSSSNDFGRDRGRAFSIGPKTQYPPNYFLPNDPQQKRLSLLPGPTSYNTIDGIGQKCRSSKHPNSGIKTFKGGQRFNKMKTLQIGPGQYKDQTITADGQYLLSTMRSSGRRIIFNSKRQNIFVKKDTIPGPGQYDQVGQFGIILKNQYSNKKSSSRPQTARH